MIDYSHLELIKKYGEELKAENGFLSGPGILAVGSITDGRFFYESHLAVVEANFGERTFLPYLERLYDYVVFCKLESIVIEDFETFSKTNNKNHNE